MRTISRQNAQQNFDRILDTVSREPVVIQSDQQNIAVLVSIKDYEIIREAKVRKLQQLCDEVSQEAKDRGLTEGILEDLLRN